jgi:hypothetical protein
MLRLDRALQLRLPLKRVRGYTPLQLSERTAEDVQERAGSRGRRCRLVRDWVSV